MDLHAHDALEDTPRARLMVARDADEAERRAQVLRAEGIDALVEIDDAQRALPGQSLLPGVLAVPGSMFAFPVTVPLADRSRALQVLDRLDGAGNASLSTAVLLRGAMLAFGLGAAALLLRVALR